MNGRLSLEQLCSRRPLQTRHTVERVAAVWCNTAHGIAYEELERFTRVKEMSAPKDKGSCSRERLSLLEAIARIWTTVVSIGVARAVREAGAQFKNGSGSIEREDGHRALAHLVKNWKAERAIGGAVDGLLACVGL